MAATTKRHPARMTAKFGCDAAGKLVACDVTAISTPAPMPRGGRPSPTACRSTPWARMPCPTCATWGEAFFTNGPPAGAFRGFGVPQAAIAHEALMDDAGRPARHRPAGVPPSQRAARRRRDGDAARCSTHSRRPRPMPRGAAAALAEGAGRGRRVQRQRRRRSGAASASAACGTASATPRCRTRRPCGSGWRPTAR